MWLLKTEPTEYSYDDLEREKRGRWDGVTNPVALRNLRAMKKGDRVLVYHTGGEKAVVGTAEVAVEAYPDPKAKDEQARGRRRGAARAAGAAGDPGRDQGDGRVRGEPARAPGPPLRGPDHRRAVEGGRGEGAKVSERVVAFSTVGKAEDAERIARVLVERRLAACVNVVPGVVSVYRWKGEVCRDEELLLVIKTRAERLEALREALVALHPYEVPELVALPIEAGHAPYLDWLDESVS